MRESAAASGGRARLRAPGGVRGDVAQPVGAVSGAGQFPDRRSLRFEDGQQPVQVPGQLSSSLCAGTGAQQPQGGGAGRGRAAADRVACLEAAGGLDAEAAGAKLGANAGKMRARRGDATRLLLQVNALSRDAERRLARLGSAS
jgi:hypothetical protein